FCLGLAFSGCASGSKNPGASGETASAAPAPAESSKAGGAAAKVVDHAQDASSEGLRCVSGKDERTLVAQAKGMGCEVLYSKGGNPRSVASARRGMDHCNQIRERMKKNLESQGFRCN